MRVLATVQSYFPFQERGGTVFKVRAIAQGLAQRGHDVTVLTADLGIGNLREGEMPFERCQWGWRSRDDGVETVYLSTLAHYRALTLNPRAIRFSLASLRRFDVVHFYGLYDLLAPIVSRFCRRQGIPYILEPMGMYRPIIRNLALKRWYHRLFGTRLAAGARFVIATSEQERQELVDAGIESSRIALRRNGVDAPDLLPPRGDFRRLQKIAENTKVILFLGRVVSKKRPDLLLEAFASWRGSGSKQRNSVLVIAGPPEGDGLVAHLRAAAKALGVSENVLFLGPLYDQEKWQAYRDADVFVLPSQNENFGNTAAEAAACGTPVIVTDRCGIAPLVESAGLVVPPQKKELEAALARILEDQDFHDQCRKGCSEMAKRLSWEAPLAESELLYERCVASQLPQEAVA
jgi:glycosyltransferase involved in cell wall biosynthesis